ncbi:MAG: glycosyltransferase family 2 protein [Bacteroidetes bacterium]|nr:glycosyltransferase family 2 protein [Bacteroidota bacterium]
MISVLIITKNEAINISKCIDSVLWSDDIHVFDSYSDDNTVEIAIKKGAKVTQEYFVGYASQRNNALKNLNFKYEWVLILDADERIPNENGPKLIKLVNEVEDGFYGFRLRRKDFFRNKWLKYSQISPYYIRLIKKGKAQYHREINEVLEVNGGVVETDLYFDHFPFSKGISHWIHKHNTYSTMEAERFILEKHNRVSFSLKQALFSNDFNIRRYHQKGWYYKLPARPILKFIYMFFWRKAFLDGFAGIHYTILQCIYEYFIVIKSREFEKKND